MHPEPPDQDGGEEHKDRLLDQLARDAPGGIAQRGPEEAIALLRERREELHADRVGRERVEADVRNEREAEDRGDSHALWRPPGAAEEKHRGHQGGSQREWQRMRNGAVAEE